MFDEDRLRRVIDGLDQRVAELYQLLQPAGQRYRKYRHHFRHFSGGLRAGPKKLLLIDGLDRSDVCIFVRVDG